MTLDQGTHAVDKAGSIKQSQRPFFLFFFLQVSPLFSRIYMFLGNYVLYGYSQKTQEGNRHAFVLQVLLICATLFYLQGKNEKQGFIIPNLWK